ncbi:---NA--- [Octopus vulgaris]|uniref:---NA n=1 Tax=Octopus vulgaris TaxID=6645 RepID=A0AA36C1H8_OCTVU|nr:---NA--- [Octopus vulgaris]
MRNFSPQLEIESPYYIYTLLQILSHPKMLVLSAVVLFISSTFLAPAEASPLPKSACKEPNVILSNSVIFGTVNGENAAVNDDEDEDYNTSSLILPVQERAVCPWKIVKLIDDNRYPRVLQTAQCKTRTWSNKLCVPVTYNVTVLYRTEEECMTLPNSNETKVYAYKADVIQLATACTSVLDATAVEQ